MSTDGGTNPFVGWYRSRIGEPQTSGEIAGYWLFVIGVVTAIVGSGWAVAQASAGPTARQGGYFLALLGLAAVVAGSVYRLPLRLWAKRATYLGSFLSVAGVFGFLAVFPNQWNAGNTELAVYVVLYVGGLAVTTAGAVFTKTDTSAVDEAEEHAEAEAAERAAVETERDELQRERDELETERDELQREHEQLETERDELQREHEQLETERDELQGEREELETQRDELQREREELEEEIEQLRRDREELEQAVAATAERAETAEDRAVTAEERLDAIEESQATFEAYKDVADEWRWRLVHQNGNIVATGAQGYSSDRTARRGIRSVKRNAPGAEVIWQPVQASEDEETEPEPTTEVSRSEAETRGRVESFEDEGGRYRWRLVHQNGQRLAVSARGYSRRSDLDDGVETVQQLVAVADYLRFDPTGIEVYEDAGGAFRWRLLHRNGNLIAESARGYTERRNAREAAERFREHAETAPVDEDDPDPVAVEVFEDAGGEFRWRLRHENGRTLADSGEGYTERNDAVEAAERVCSYAPDANILTVGPAVFELFEDDAGEDRWRLRHRNGTLLARSADGFASRSNAVENVNSVKRNLPNAPTEWTSTDETDDETADDANDETADDTETEPETEAGSESERAGGTEHTESDPESGDE